MAAYKRLALLETQTIGSSTTTVGNAVGVGNATEIVGVCEVSDRTDGTYTLTLQHSADGIIWHTLKAASAQSANGQELAVVDSTPMHLIRASLVSGSVTTGADVECYIMYSDKR